VPDGPFNRQDAKEATAEGTGYAVGRKKLKQKEESKKLKTEN